MTTKDTDAVERLTERYGSFALAYDEVQERLDRAKTKEARVRLYQVLKAIGEEVDANEEEDSWLGSCGGDSDRQWERRQLGLAS